MKIVIGVDGRERQSDAVALGRVLAATAPAEIVVAHVYPLDWVMPAVGPRYEEAMREDAETIVEAAGSELGHPYRGMVVGDSSPSRGLHRLVEREHADVLVLASSHHGRVGRVLLGGVAERVVHGAPCAIAVAPRGYAGAERHLRRIGVAYDGGPEARVALDWAQRLARSAHADLTLFRVLESPYVAVYPTVAPNKAVEEAERLQGEDLRRAVAGVPAEFHATGELVHGRTRAALATAATDVDLLVCGSRGYGAVGTVLLGSVARGLLSAATRPVVILPRSAAAATADEGVTVAASTVTA